MPTSPSTSLPAAEGTLIRVMDNGEVLELDYGGNLGGHPSSLWWGTASAFRALQAVALEMSKDGTLWSRDDLYVVSAHPGRGVRDTFEYVTKAISRDRWKVIQERDCGMRCNSTMRYDWWVSDGERTASVSLREDFVPGEFYALMDRLGLPTTTAQDIHDFDIFKVDLASKLWVSPLEDNYTVEVTDQPLPVGDRPQITLRPDYWKSVKDLVDATNAARVAR